METIRSEHAPNAIGPYSQAIRHGNLLFTSGQVPLDPATGKLVDKDFDSQVRQVFENMKAVLSAAGADFQKVVKATVYLTDFANFAAMNAIYSEYMGEHKPARSTVAVSALPLNAPIEIDLIAVLD